MTIADEATFLVEATGEQLTLEQYLDHTRHKVAGYVPEWARLREVWADAAKREPFVQALEAASIHVDVLGEVLAQPETDQFVVVAHIALGTPSHTLSELAEAFLNREPRLIQEHEARDREVILALLDKYRLAGIQEMARPEIFRLSPFLRWARHQE